MGFFLPVSIDFNLWLFSNKLHNDLLNITAEIFFGFSIISIKVTFKFLRNFVRFQNIPVQHELQLRSTKFIPFLKCSGVRFQNFHYLSSAILIRTKEQKGLVVYFLFSSYNKLLLGVHMWFKRFGK